MATPRTIARGQWPDLVEPGNLDLKNRPEVANPEGGTSSVYSMSVGFDDGEYLIPRVSEDGRLMSEEEAIDEFKKTGNHLGVFKTPESATQYSEELHKQQASKFGEWFVNLTNDPEFRNRQPQSQLKIIWSLMDQDELTKDLNDDERMKFLDEFNKEPEKPGLGDWAVEKGIIADIPGVENLSKETLDRIGRKEGFLGKHVLQPAASLATSILGTGIPDTLEGVAESYFPAATQGVREAFDEISGGKGDPRFKEALESDLELAERGVSAGFGAAAEWMREEFKGAQEALDTSSWEDIKESFGEGDIIGGISDTANWIANGAANTIGYVAPSAAISAVTGAPLWASMSPTLAGSSMQTAREKGVELTPFEGVMTGLTQGKLEALFGIESVIGGAPKTFVQEVFSQGWRRGLARFIGEAGGEWTTEAVQNWIDIQYPNWKKGDQGYWDNLTGIEKRSIIESASLAAIISIPSAAVGAARGGLLDQALENAKKRADLIGKLRGLTPEERGAEGFVATPRPVRELTEEQINQVRTNYAPEWLTEGQATQFVNGTLDYKQFTEEQQDELHEANRLAEEEIGPQEDLSVEAVPEQQITEEQATGIDEIKALAILKQRQLASEGNEEGAAEIQKAIDSIEIVNPKSEELRTVQGFASKFGNINFFRAENGHLLGSDGISVGTNGDIFVRWDASAPHVVAAVALHEVVHAVGKRNFDALKALYDSLSTALPDVVAQYEKVIRDEHANVGITLTDEDMVHEVVAYMGQNNARDIFRALQVASQNMDVKSPGPIKSMVKALWDGARKVVRAVPGLEQQFPYLKEDFDIKNKEMNTRLANHFVKFLQQGQRESLNIQADNFGRRGRKQLDYSEAPVPQPRTPTIVEDTAPRRPLTITEDASRTAARNRLDINEVAPPAPRGEALITEEEPAVEEVPAETAREAVQQDLLKTPSKPAEVRLGPKPKEAVRAPRKPAILLDEPMIRTTASKLEVGDELEVDDEVVSVTRAEMKNGKYTIGYVNRDGDLSTVTVAPNKRFMKFENPQEEPQRNLFDEGMTVTPEQQQLNFEAMEKFEAEVEADTKFSLKIENMDSYEEWGTRLEEKYGEEEGGKRAIILDRMRSWEKYKQPGTKTLMLLDETGHRGFAVVYERYFDQRRYNDREVYVDFVECLYDKNGKFIRNPSERLRALGVKNVATGRAELAKMFPNSIWVGGFRVDGARKGSPEYMRMPLYDTRSRRTGEGLPEWWTDDIVSEGSIPQDVLEMRHAHEGMWGTEYDPNKDLSKTMEEKFEEELDRRLEEDGPSEIGEYTEILNEYDRQAEVFQSDDGEIDAALVEQEERLARQDAADALLAEWRKAKDKDEKYSVLAQSVIDRMYSLSGVAGKLASEFTSEDWNALGKEHGVKNLGGMGKMVEIHPGVEIPGGLDGTFTYEEILWLKHQAIDVYTMPEDTHRQLHEKIVRTMQPDPNDTLQILNHFMFSMLSPNQPLTPNELAYAVVRVRNMEESAEWAKRVPWDVMKGENGNAEAFLKYDKDNEEVISFIKAAYLNAERERRKRKKIKEKPQTRSIEWLMENRAGGTYFDKWYRNYYNSKIAQEFGLQAKSKGGIGLLGTAEMTNIAELNQFYQADPDWFKKQNALDGTGPTSWHAYVERLGSQFRGMATKVASFAAVWQDPLFAAISAVDRHMGRIYESELFKTPQERLEWERKVIKEWNEGEGGKKEGRIKTPVLNKKTGEIKFFDELFMKPGGDGHFVKAIMDKMKPGKAVFTTKSGERNKNLSQHWREWEGHFLGENREISISKMSEHYKNALKINAERANALGMGLFATQWFLWDRYRRRLEPHEINFPGLYKLPHLPLEQVKSALDAHSEFGYLAGTKEKVPVLDSEGRPTPSVDIRLKPVRTAPLGSLNYFSFSDGPGHFPPGQGFRTPLYNLHQAQPLSGVDPDTGPMWGLPDKTWQTWLINKFQDKFYRVKQLQKEIEKKYGNIHEDMDAYLTEMLYHGKAADQVEAFEHAYVDPLIDYLHKNEIDIPEFEEWLHARHAEERNNHLDEIWEKRKRRNLEKEISDIQNQLEYAEAQGIDTTVLKRRLHSRKSQLAFLPKNKHHSGMSNEQASEILRKAGNKFDGAAKLFDKMMDQKLEVLYEAGLITEEQLKKVKVYKYYAPLKGKEYKGDLEEILEDANIHTGQGFDIRGDELGFSFGRVGDSRHTRPILAQAVVDIEESIVRANKNEVGKAFLELVRAFPNDSLYKVNTVTQRRVWDKKTGTVKLVKDAFANREDNVIAVKEGGKTHYIEIYDARLASAMKNLGSGPMHGAIRLIAGFNRFMAAVNTTYNPEFVVANLLRDVQTAGLNMSTEELGALRSATLLNVPKAINAIRKAEGLTLQEDIESDEWVKYFREYVADGGKIGFFGYTDVVSKAKAIQRKVERAGDHKIYTTFSYMQNVADLVSSANSSVENASRLSVYVAARKAGISRKKAAAIGRNLTVNFNKKGDAGQVLNALYLFSNASIQGTARMFSAIMGSKRLKAMVGAQIAASWAIAALNRGLGGDDEEDGYAWWEKIGDWEKERSLIIMLPDGEGHHIKIPLPYGYNVFHVIGTQMEAASHAILSGTSTAEGTAKGIANMFSAVMTAFNPLGGMSLDSKWQMIRPLIPSAAAPVFDTFVNQTYYGAPIAPVRSSWDHSPESQRYFKSVNPLVRDLTTYLNRWTGGNEYESGWLDQNPETLEYLLGSYAGAGAKTVVRTLFTDPSWAFDAVRGRDTSKYEMNDVAFLRRVFGEVNDYTADAVFYENIAPLDQAEKAFKNLKGEQLADWKEGNGWMVPLFTKLKEAEKGIRDTDDPDAKTRIRKGFNKAYREAWLSQF